MFIRDDWASSLKVGDAVICKPNNWPGKRHVVVRITKTQVILDGSGGRFRRSDGRSIPFNTWSPTYIEPINEAKPEE